MYNLYLDESGTPSLKDLGIGLSHFSISGVLVHENSSKFITERMNQIKFKYFGSKKVVFHSYDIVNNIDDYSIFRTSPILKKEFLSDLTDFIEKASFKIVYYGVSKSDYLDNNPELKKLIEQNIDIKKYEKSFVSKIFTNIFETYLSLLKKRSKKDKPCRGKIIMESGNLNQDIPCFEAYHNIMGGSKKLNLKNVEVRKFLTSISFSTKVNDSAEVELADMVSYFLNLNQRFEDGATKKVKSNSLDITNILKSKILVL